MRDRRIPATIPTNPLMTTPRNGKLREKLIHCGFQRKSRSLAEKLPAELLGRGRVTGTGSTGETDD